MYVIIVYDVGVERVAKICQYLRRSMDWVQNSVFEGELTDAEYKRIQHDLKGLIEAEADSVRLYTFRTREQVNLEILGVEKADTRCIV